MENGRTLLFFTRLPYMLSYIVRRILQNIPLVLLILTLVFFLLNILPGDAALLSGDVRLSRSPEVIDAIRARWGLDQPLHIRYFTYISNILRGDLGTSYRTFERVSVMVMEAILPTFQLVIFSFLIALFFGVLLGFIASLYQGSIIDLITMITAIIGISAPNFWVGLMLMYFFAVILGLLPSSGYGGGSISFMILPAITLGIPLIALLARSTRAAVLDVAQEDYVRTARSKGLSERIVQFRHVLRNALIPTMTIAALQLATLMANTVIVEKVFSWPGIGSLVVDSIFRRDIPVVQGCILVFSLGFILINLLADVLYGYLDPRIAYD